MSSWPLSMNSPPSSRVDVRGNAAIVRLDATADVIRALIEPDGEAGPRQQVGCVQAGYARAHDGDFDTSVRGSRGRRIGREYSRGGRPGQKLPTVCLGISVPATMAVLSTGRIKGTSEVDEESGSPVRAA